MLPNQRTPCNAAKPKKETPLDAKKKQSLC